MRKLAVVGLVIFSLAMAGCMCMLPEKGSGHGDHGDSHPEEQR